MKVLKTFPGTTCVRKRGSSIYPLDEWLDGRVRQISPGVDFTCSRRSMQLMLYKWAHERQKTVTTRFMEDGSLVFQCK